MRIWKGLVLAFGLWLSAFGWAAAQDPLAEMVLGKVREAVATEPAAQLDASALLAEQARYLMTVKDGMSLYRDGLLAGQDKQALADLVARQVKASTDALGAGVAGDQKALAGQMHQAALAADQLLKMEPAGAGFTALMEQYHTGAGYRAYRLAQDIGIEQY